MTTEAPEHRIKRMNMRSWRRGTKEMDLILGPFADNNLGSLSDSELVLYDQLLDEYDHDLYRWITGQEPTPKAFGDLLEKVARHAGML